MSGRWLVAFDADRISDYVFATGRLREIRGASERVRQLTDAKELEKTYPRWRGDTGEGLIYAGGGAGALLFANAGAAESCRVALERTYRQGTAGATLTAVAVDVPPDADSAVEAAAQTAAARALARRKLNRPVAEELAGGLVRFCESDRLHPASAAVDDPGGAGPLLVSAMTDIKWKTNRRFREALREQPWWERFLASTGTLRSAWEDAVNERQELGQIGALADPSGYVAFVHVDGDRIGQTLKGVVADGGFAAWQAFSEALTAAAHEATGAALGAAYGGSAPRRVQDPESGDELSALPFEVITVGGDDILLICTGEQGLRIATGIGREFGAAVAAEMARREVPFAGTVTASAGVVIAHASVPIPVLKRGADALKQRAKQTAGGALDFQVVTTPGLDDIGRIREREYQEEIPAAVLTKRPYPLSAAETLLDHAAILRQRFPTSKLADFYGACRGERLDATLNVLSIHARLDPDNQAALNEALAELDSAAPYPFGGPDGDGEVRTALLDLIEASRFVVPASAPA